MVKNKVCVGGGGRLVLRVEHGEERGERAIIDDSNIIIAGYTILQVALCVLV